MTKIQTSKPVYDLEERTFQLFWSLDIEYWNLFVIWVLKFGALKLGSCILGFYIQVHEPFTSDRPWWN
jgi:hypothetical protein